MFQKVLVAEDMSSINEGVSAILKKAGVPIIHHAQYCDEAFLKIKKAQSEKVPYELLISDMSFKKDHREETITNGEELIAKARAHQPELKIVAYSIEDKVAKVKRLFDKHAISGYVCKDRKGLTELMNAVESAFKNETFVSPIVSAALNKKGPNTEFTDYDAALLKLIASGISQSELSKSLENLDLSPSSKSAIEKRLSALKTMFNSNNTIHLVATAKDLGLI